MWSDEEPKRSLKIGFLYRIHINGCQMELNIHNLGIQTSIFPPAEGKKRYKMVFIGLGIG